MNFTSLSERSATACWRRPALALACALAFGSTHAQTAPDRASELEQLLKQSLQQIESLKQRVQQLENKSAPVRPAAAAAPAAAANAGLSEKVTALEGQVNAISTRPEEDRGLDMHGFVDVGFVAGDKNRPTGGYMGKLDFYLTPKFGDRVKSLMELNFETSEEGVVSTDVERMQIGYTVSENLTAWAGRFHTPFGYWNTAFHHGAQLQTSILRPKFLEFEDAGGILPAHTVGLWGTGGVKTAGGRVGYDVYVGNSPSIDLGDTSVGGDGTLNPGLHGSKYRNATFGANLNYNFRGDLNGFTVGTHVLSSKIGDDLAAGQNLTQLRMYGAWLTYLEDDWEVMVEGYGFRNSDLSGGTGSHTSSAGYAQVGRLFGNNTPFVRFEKTKFDQNDQYFAQQASGRSYERTAIGWRYDFNPKTAIKLEAVTTNLTDPGGERYSELWTQFAVRF